MFHERYKGESVIRPIAGQHPSRETARSQTTDSMQESVARLVSVCLCCRVCRRSPAAPARLVCTAWLSLVGGSNSSGPLRHVRGCVDLGIVASLVMPSDALWRRVASRIPDPFVSSCAPALRSITFPPVIKLAV